MSSRVREVNRSLRLRLSASRGRHSDNPPVNDGTRARLARFIHRGTWSEENHDVPTRSAVACLLDCWSREGSWCTHADEDRDEVVHREQVTDLRNLR